MNWSFPLTPNPTINSTNTTEKAIERYQLYLGVIELLNVFEGRNIQIIEAAQLQASLTRIYPYPESEDSKT